MRQKLVILAFLLVLFSCQAPRNKTVDLLTDVKTDLLTVKENLVDARSAIDSAESNVDRSLVGVSSAKQTAKTDAKELAKVRDEFNDLRNNLWVRIALEIRKWFYYALTAYIVGGVLSGILLARGVAVPFATQLLDFLPLSQIFKAVGLLFRRKT